MPECPGCLGEGVLDCRDTDAVLAEQFKTWSRDRVVLFASHDPELVQACGASAINVAALR